jgi:hypothetical protein
MKKLVILLICLCMAAASACSHTTADNDSPEELYKQDNSIDLLVYNGTAYVNASDLDWVMELELTAGEKLGEIGRTKVTKDFEGFDATVLETGTEVYSVKDRDDFVLVMIDNKLVPYYAYVEG